MKDLMELYQNLYLLSKKQNELILSEDYDSLVELLDTKQELINEIDVIDIKEYVLKQGSPEIFLSDLKSIMEKLKELEDNNSEMIQKNYGDMKDKLKVINTRQKSRKGYQTNNKFDAKFIDKKG